MPQWILDGVQWLHIGFLLVACISVEWRRPAGILLGFASLYLYLSKSGINDLFRDYDSSLFMLMYVALDMLGAMMIFELCRPTKENKTFTEGSRLGLSAILTGFWVAHFLNFNYTMGYAMALPTLAYEMTGFLLGLLTPFFLFPGSKDGYYEAKRVVMEARANRAVPGYWIRSILDSLRNSGRRTVFHNVLRRDFQRHVDPPGLPEMDRGEEP